MFIILYILFIFVAIIFVGTVLYRVIGAELEMKRKGYTRTYIIGEIYDDYDEFQ